MPLVRISDELYEKIRKIHDQTGLSLRVILDNMGKNMEFEVKIIVKERDK